FVQVTGVPEPPGRPAEPQQSLSFVHTSPKTWQPLAGWQMRTPVGPYGAQRRLQQAPPHAGMPPSPRTAPPAQSMPSVRLQLAEPVASGAQVPFVAPAAMVQVPLQQSALSEQTSPVCVQNEGGKQTPLKQ